MTEPGGDGEKPDQLPEEQGATGGPCGDGTGGRRRGSSSGNSTDQIMNRGGALLRGFIEDRVQRKCREEEVNRTKQELGGNEEPPMDPSTKRLSECLRKIGDELDGNMELQRMIDQVPINSPKDVFFQVACQMFADGTFNWGRVVALFYFACKLVLKALISNVPQLIRTIYSWTMDYLQEHLLQWIRDQGGWESLLGTPTWQTIGIFVAGVLTASLTFWKLS
ncbi:apoptosis regulator BAX [Ambystoma mexicanum]|uniref:apoptosis regulator BAX n=1 Tax=Ambystoma mexicanum TaxID=8296 RepID=UPI0037E93DFB